MHQRKGYLADKMEGWRGWNRCRERAGEGESGLEMDVSLEITQM